MKQKKVLRIFGVCLCLSMILRVSSNVLAAQDESSNLGMVIYTPEIADEDYQFIETKLAAIVDNTFIDTGCEEDELTVTEPFADLLGIGTYAGIGTRSCNLRLSV